MSKGKSGKTTYKPYEQNRPYLIPPSADGLIPAGRLARLANEAIDGTGIERLLGKYRTGGGASRRRPAMTAKLFVQGQRAKAR